MHRIVVIDNFIDPEDAIKKFICVSSDIESLKFTYPAFKVASAPAVMSGAPDPLTSVP